MRKTPNQLSNTSPEALLTGETDSQLAFRFSLEYVKSYGDSVKAYMKTFGVSRQRAHIKVDDYMRNPAVVYCISQVTAPTETIASAGEVLAAVTTEMRNAPDAKDRLRAAEMMLKVRGHMDRDKKSSSGGSPANVLITMVKQYANASPMELEARLIGGGHAIRGSVGEGGEIADLQGSGQLDEVSEGDFLDAAGESFPSGFDSSGDDEARSPQTEGGTQ